MYWKIKFYGHDALCVVKEIKTSWVCIVDELKIIFGIPKLGTHRVYLKNKQYLLILAKTNKNGVIEREETLKKTNHSFDKLFHKKVQKILLFRNILKITKSNESSINIRINNQGDIFPISCNEYNFSLTTALSSNLIHKWFSNNSLNDLAQQIFDINHTSDIPYKIAIIRNRIEQIIKRVDYLYIWTITFIIENLSKKLIFI